MWKTEEVQKRAAGWEQVAKLCLTVSGRCVSDDASEALARSSPTAVAGLYSCRGLCWRINQDGRLTLHGQSVLGAVFHPSCSITPMPTCAFSRQEALSNMLARTDKRLCLAERARNVLVIRFDELVCGLDDASEFWKHGTDCVGGNLLTLEGPSPASYCSKSSVTSGTISLQRFLSTEFCVFSFLELAYSESDSFESY